MDSAQQSGGNISKFSRGLMAAFAISLLVSIYLLMALPSDLQFKGNLQYLDLVTPILIKLYVSLGITAILAFVALYAEMKNTKVAIVFKDKTASQAEEEKIQTEASRTDSLDSKSVTGKNDTELLSNSLSAIANKLDGVSGACYISKEVDGMKRVELVSGFALPLAETDVIQYNYGEGLVGQVAKSGTSIYVDEIPEGYFQVVSGLGKAVPKFILVQPIKKNNTVKGVLELATFRALNENERKMAEKFSGEIGERLS
jgi:hypothetical protein